MLSWFAFVVSLDVVMKASRKEPPSFLIVDGNNIIHAWEDLHALHRQRRGLGHTELLRQLRQFHDVSDFRVVVVFDGKRGPLQEEREAGGFQVIYTDGGSTADDIIERLAARYAKRYRLVVATNDRAEQDLVIAFGAEVWTAAMLQTAVEGESGSWRRYLAD